MLDIIAPQVHPDRDAFLLKDLLELPGGIGLLPSALSGIYTAKYGFGDYMDEVVYQNSPVDYMANFPTDHPYMDLYRR